MRPCYGSWERAWMVARSSTSPIGSTPEVEPRRYDTRFFAARVAGSNAVYDEATG